MQVASRSHHDSEDAHNIGQGEAQHRKNRRLKLSSGQAYDVEMS